MGEWRTVHADFLLRSLLCRLLCSIFASCFLFCLVSFLLPQTLMDSISLIRISLNDIMILGFLKSKVPVSFLFFLSFFFFSFAVFQPGVCKGFLINALLGVSHSILAEDCSLQSPTHHQVFLCSHLNQKPVQLGSPAVPSFTEAGSTLEDAGHVHACFNV